LARREKFAIPQPTPPARETMYSQTPGGGGKSWRRRSEKEGANPEAGVRSNKGSVGKDGKKGGKPGN